MPKQTKVFLSSLDCFGLILLGKLALDDERDSTFTSVDFLSSSKEDLIF